MGISRVWVGEGGQKEREKEGEGGRQTDVASSEEEQSERERKEETTLPWGKEKVRSRWLVS